MIIFQCWGKMDKIDKKVIDKKDEVENLEKYKLNQKKRLDLNDLLARMKKTKNYDRKVNLFIISVTTIVVVSAALIILLFL